MSVFCICRILISYIITQKYLFSVKILALLHELIYNRKKD